MCPHIRQRRILTNASRAIRLNRTVKRFEKGLGNEHLGLGDFFAGGGSIGVVDADGGVEDDQTRSVDVDAGLGDALQLDLVFGELDAKRLLAGVVDAGDEVVERFLGLERVSMGAFVRVGGLLTEPIDLMAWWIRPGPRRPWIISKPRPGPRTMWSAGTRTLLKDMWPCPWGASS
jgi:hypothetical protein